MGDDTYLLLGRDLLLPADLGPDGGQGSGLGWEMIPTYYWGRDLLLPADLGPDGGLGTCGDTGRGPATRNVI